MNKQSIRNNSRSNTIRRCSSDLSHTNSNLLYIGEAPWIQTISGTEDKTTLEYLPIDDYSSESWAVPNSEDVTPNITADLWTSVIGLTGKVRNIKGTETFIDDVETKLSLFNEFDYFSYDKNDMKIDLIRCAMLKAHNSQNYGLKAVHDHVQKKWSAARTNCKDGKPHEEVVEELKELLKDLNNCKERQINFLRALQNQDRLTVRRLLGNKFTSLYHDTIDQIIRKEKTKIVSSLRQYGATAAKEFPLTNKVSMDGGLARGSAYLYISRWFQVVMEGSLPPVKLCTPPISVKQHILAIKGWTEKDFVVNGNRKRQDEAVLRRSLIAYFKNYTFNKPNNYNGCGPKGVKDSSSNTHPYSGDPALDVDHTNNSNDRSLDNIIDYLLPPYALPHVLCRGYHYDLFDIIQCTRNFKSHNSTTIQIQRTTPLIAHKIKNGFISLLKHADRIRNANNKYSQIRKRMWQNFVTQDVKKKTEPITEQNENELIYFLECFVMVPLNRIEWKDVRKQFLLAVKDRNVKAGSVILYSEKSLFHHEYLELLNTSTKDQMNGLITHYDKVEEFIKTQQHSNRMKLEIMLDEFLSIYKELKHRYNSSTKSGSSFISECHESLSQDGIDDFLFKCHNSSSSVQYNSEDYRKNVLYVMNEVAERFELLKILTGEISKLKVTLGISESTSVSIKLGMILESLKNQNKAKGSQKYIALKCLGRGGFAEVWEVLSTKAELKRYAAKITFLNKGLSAMDREIVLSITCREVKLQGLIQKHHDQFVSMVECFEIAPHIFCSIMDLAMPFDLQYVITLGRCFPNGHKAIPRALIHCLEYCGSAACVKAWIKSLLKALLTLERLEIIHRDIKPANVLLLANEDIYDIPLIKLADFGLARIVRRTKQGSLPCIADYSENEERSLGTMLYQSPEACLGRLQRIKYNLTYAEDMWQVGVLCYGLIFQTEGGPYGQKDVWGSISPNSLEMLSHNNNLHYNESSDFVAATIVHDAATFGYWNQDVWNPDRLDFPWRVIPIAISGLTSLEQAYLRDLIGQ